MDYLTQNDQVLVAPGSGYVVPEEDSQITTLRGQCKASIVDYSWKMVFASDEDEFNSLLEEMQKTLKGLDYDTVLEYDMQCAKDQQAAREQVVKDYEEENGSVDSAAADATETPEATEAATETPAVDDSTSEDADSTDNDSEVTDISDADETAEATETPAA